MGRGFRRTGDSPEPLMSTVQRNLRVLACSGAAEVIAAVWTREEEPSWLVALLLLRSPLTRRSDDAAWPDTATKTGLGPVCRAGRAVQGLPAHLASSLVRLGETQVVTLAQPACLGLLLLDALLIFRMVGTAAVAGSASASSLARRTSPSRRRAAGAAAGFARSRRLKVKEGGGRRYSHVDGVLKRPGHGASSRCLFSRSLLCSAFPPFAGLPLSLCRSKVVLDRSSVMSGTPCRVQKEVAPPPREGRPTRCCGFRRYECLAKAAQRGARTRSLLIDSKAE